jgi:tetratricopeptide (TPR) repeat protein
MAAVPGLSRGEGVGGVDRAAHGHTGGGVKVNGGRFAGAPRRGGSALGRAARLLGAVAGAVCALEQTALAQIDPWARARDPAGAKAGAWADVLDRDRVSIDPYLQGASAQQKLNQRCAVKLQLVGAQLLGGTTALVGSKDGANERAAFLLAECLSQAHGQYQGEARDAWATALERWPSSPRAAHGFGALGMAQLALDEPGSADVALGASLELEWDAETRARLSCVRGQLAMHTGRLKRAMSDFWAAMNEAQEMETYALAQWGLGVALDRARNFPEAVAPALAASRARFGNAGRTSVLDLETTVLFPSEDEHYYRALGLMADAASNKGRPGYVSHLQSAQLMWLQFLDAAPSTNLGVVRAREHLRTIRRELGSDDE